MTKRLNSKKSLTAVVAVMTMILFALALPALADNEEKTKTAWVELMKSSSGHVIYVNPSKVAKKKDGTVDIWLMFEEPDGASYMGNYLIDCEKSLFFPKKYYNIAGKKKYEKNNREKTGKWISIADGSPIMAIKDAFCAETEVTKNQPSEIKTPAPEVKAPTSESEVTTSESENPAPEVESTSPDPETTLPEEEPASPEEHTE